MLTLIDHSNIKRFNELSKNHQKVFRYRIKNKFKGIFNDILTILDNYEKLGISPEKLINLSQLMKIIEKYKEVIQKEEAKRFK